MAAGSGDSTVSLYSAWSTEDLIAQLKKYKQDVADSQSRIEKWKEELSHATNSDWKAWCETMIMNINSRISDINHHIMLIQQELSARAVDLKDVMKDKVERKENKSLILGGGGVGKTHLAALLLKKPVPLKRVSTPCAEALPWLLSSSQVQKSLTGIIVLTDEMYTALMMTLRAKVESGCVEEVDADIPLACASMVLNSEGHSLENTSTVSDVDLHFLVAETRMKEFEHTGGQIFGRIIDIGGQPQLLELLPRFISDITHGAIVIDLSQSLDKYPTSYFYGAKGKSIGFGIRSNLTNEQIVRIFFQMVASISTDKKKVKIIIVGTHRDVEWKCLESRGSKEEKLKAIVSSYGLEENVIYTDETHTSLIFAVNAKNPKGSDRNTAEKIMDIMMSEEDAVDISIPLKHHKLELTAQMLLGSERIAVPFNELYSNMSIHYDSPEAMTEGLEFLNNSFRLFYFKEFPKLVFGIPQRLLNLMTEITVYHIRLTTNPDQKATSEGIWIQFKEQGIVNEKILEKISKCFDDVFTPKDMIEVMEKLSIICKLKEEKYLMPSLLTTLATLPHSQTSRLRWLPFGLGKYFQRLISGLKSDITMLAYFPVGLSRFGVYCGTVCKLISEYKWKLTREVSRNRFQFTQPDSPGVVSFIDSFDSFFVVNLDIPSEFPSEEIATICHNVSQTIFSAVKKVIAELGYTPSDPVVAFLCDHDSSIPHAAEYLQQYRCLRCVQKNDHLIQLTHNHQLWLDRNAAASKNESYQEEDLRKDISKPKYQKQHRVSMDCHQVYKKISENNRAKLQEEIKSDHHIRRIAEQMTEWEEKYDLFHLGRHEVYDIKNGQNKDRPILQRIDVLHAWKEKFLYPTYKCLLEILVEGGFTDCITVMVTIINEDWTERS